MTLPKTAMILLLGPLLSMAQSSTIPLSSPKQYGSPVVLRGQLSAITKIDSSGHSFKSFEGSILGTNVSKKDILLLITRVRTTGLASGDVTDFGVYDYFFNTDAFRSGTTEVFHESGPPVLEGMTEPRSAEPGAKAVATVTFVQFSDGATWGDQTQAEGALRQRSRTWAKLRSLAETLRDKGEEQFVIEMMRPPEPEFLGDAYIASLRMAYTARGNDARPATEILNRMLRCAELHQDAIGRLP